MKILVADDDELALIVANKVLQSDGHEVFLAEDGESALNQIAKTGTQVIISDWNMPIMVAWSYAQELRETPDMGLFTSSWLHPDRVKTT